MSRTKKSPGTETTSPKTRCEGETSSADFGVVRSPRRTQGSCWIQLPSVHLAIIAALREQWKRSTMPLASGL